MRALTAPQALPALLAQQVQEYLVQRELLVPQGLVLMEQQVPQVLA